MDALFLVEHPRGDMFVCIDFRLLARRRLWYRLTIVGRSFIKGSPSCHVCTYYELIMNLVRLVARELGSLQRDVQGRV